MILLCIVRADHFAKDDRKLSIKDICYSRSRMVACRHIMTISRSLLT